MFELFQVATTRAAKDEIYALFLKKESHQRWLFNTITFPPVTLSHISQRQVRKYIRFKEIFLAQVHLVLLNRRN